MHREAIDFVTLRRVLSKFRLRCPCKPMACLRVFPYVYRVDDELVFSFPASMYASEPWMDGHNNFTFRSLPIPRPIMNSKPMDEYAFLLLQMHMRF